MFIAGVIIFCLACWGICKLFGSVANSSFGRGFVEGFVGQLKK